MLVSLDEISSVAGTEKSSEDSSRVQTIEKDPELFSVSPVPEGHPIEEEL